MLTIFTSYWKSCESWHLVEKRNSRKNSTGLVLTLILAVSRSCSARGHSCACHGNTFRANASATLTRAASLMSKNSTETSPPPAPCSRLLRIHSPNPSRKLHAKLDSTGTSSPTCVSFVVSPRLTAGRGEVDTAVLDAPAYRESPCLRASTATDFGLGATVNMPVSSHGSRGKKGRESVRCPVPRRDLGW